MEKRRYGPANKRTQFLMDSNELGALVAPNGRKGWTWEVINQFSLDQRGNGKTETRDEAEAQALAALAAAVRADIADMEAELKEMEA